MSLVHSLTAKVLAAVAKLRAKDPLMHLGILVSGLGLVCKNLVAAMSLLELN